MGGVMARKPGSNNEAFEQIKQQYELEKRLADRLRNASKEERSMLYSTVYDELYRNSSHWSNQPLELAEMQVRLLRRFVDRDDVFLEIGPGDCSVSIEMAKSAKRVYAVDVSKIRTGNSEWPQNFKLFLTDGCSIPLPESVDVAYSNQLMEHLHPDDALEQLQNIRDVLSPNGIYICITPNRLCEPHDVSKYFDEVPKGLHLKEYTITELVALFKVAGFSRVRAFVSCKGFILSPFLPALPFTWIEDVLSILPLLIRKPVARLLHAVKIVGIR